MGGRTSFGAGNSGGSVSGPKAVVDFGQHGDDGLDDGPAKPSRQIQPAVMTAELDRAGHLGRYELAPALAQQPCSLSAAGLRSRTAVIRYGRIGT